MSLCVALVMVIHSFAFVCSAFVSIGHKEGTQ